MADRGSGPHRAPAVTHKGVLAIALPIVISNISTPLLGLVDTAVMGQLGSPRYIGAVAIGAIIFTSVYWAFGFLRMGTTGLTAQAHGARDGGEVRAALGRALAIAAVAGLGLIVLQAPIEAAAFYLLDGSAAVEALAQGYFGIRIWSAPFALANYALLGWFIAIQRARTALALQLVLNGTNAVLDVVFVIGFGWGVAGVAAGTLIAEITAALAGLVIAANVLKGYAGAWDMAALRNWSRMARTIAVNRDIMIRTLLLMFAFAFFTAQGAAAGNTVLAVNAILMQFVALAAYFLDGFAFAAEALVGQALGARARATLQRAVALSSVWSGTLSLLLAALFLAGGGWFIDLLTVDEGVRQAARAFLPWAALLPVVSFPCYQLDGIFIGATNTGQMRNAAIASLAVFLAAWWLLTPWGNHGLWASFAVYNAARAAFLALYYPALLRAVPVR